GAPVRGLQGRAPPPPPPPRARQDPAEPALGNLRPAPAPAQHRDQAGQAAGAPALHQGLRRLSPNGAAGPGPAGRGSRAGLGPLLVALVYLLLAPPAFLLGPLAGLLVVSRPPTFPGGGGVGVSAARGRPAVP